MAKKKQTNKIEFEKLPPSAVEIENAVLGIIFLDAETMHESVEIIPSPDVFYNDKNRIIYTVMLELFKQNEPVDLLTVRTRLDEKGLLEQVGGASYLISLQSTVSSTAYFEYYAKIITQKYLQRELIKAANEILENAYDEDADVADLLNESEKLLFNISEGQLKQQTDPVNKILEQVILDVEHAAQNQNDLIGVPSGYTALDSLTNGWQGGNLIIIAARPSMGKTAFALNIMRNAAVEFGFPVAIFSLEMEKKELVRRLVASEAHIDSRKLMTGELTEDEWKQLNSRIEKLSKAPIYINDSSLSVFELRALARRLKKRYDIKMLIIDYLQLMNADNVRKSTNREQEVSIISRSLKTLAKELDIPIIALSQLNRELEKRSGVHKRPQLSDLRESGAIEQDADMVLFIHRPERLGITEIDGESTEGLAEIIIAKNRNGVTDTVKLRFIGKYTQFTDWDDDELPFNEESSIILPSRANEDSDGVPPDFLNDINTGDSGMMPPDLGGLDDAPF